MSESPPAHPTANNCFAGAIRKLMNDPKYESSVSMMAQMSQLLVKMDSQVPGAMDCLMNEILRRTST